MKKFVLSLTTAFFTLMFTGMLTSCPTIPAEKTPSDWLGILPRNGSFYLYINHTRANPVIKGILKKAGQLGPSVQAVLDRTQKSYLSVRLTPGGRTEVSFVLLGGYPAGYIRGVLKRNKEWRLVENQVSYYQNIRQPLQVAIPKPYMFLITSGGDIRTMLTHYTDESIFPLEKDIGLDMKSSDLLLFFPLGLENHVADRLHIDWRKISVREIWLTGRTTDDGYTFSGIFLIANKTGARLFSTIFKLSLAALLRDIDVESAGKRLKNVRVLIKGTQVQITDFYLSNDELITMISSILATKEDKK